jgi:TonB-linked SusC/RagA family outer membrane protein
MKKTYSYFIIHRYEKGIRFSAKLAFALLLTALVQFSVKAAPLNGHNRVYHTKGPYKNNLTSKSAVAKTQLADIKVTGKITDATGESLIGATVALKNGKGLTVTDINGNFIVTVPENAILVISYIGYQTQEVAVAGQTQLNIVLKEAAGNLNEVVVVGYGTQHKKDLTGAVSVISAKDIEGIAVGDASQILQGKAAGVSVTENSGAPGGGIAVQIRGVGTINGVSPLYIVDGIPTQDGINEISPNDIESFSILKDASSAAIYGARAAGGVVIITTKHGVAGKTKVSASAYTGLQSAQNLIPMANNAQYITAYNTAAANDGRPGITNALINSLGTTPGTYPLSNTNWLSALLRPAPITNASLSLSGGSDNTNFMISGNFFNQDGLIENSSYNRFNLHTVINSQLSKYLKVGTNINLAYSKQRQVGDSGDGSVGAASVIRYALFRTPGTPVRDPSGQFVSLPEQDQSAGGIGNFLGDGYNPVQLAANTDNNFYNYSILGDVFAELTPIKGLKIRSDLGLDMSLVNNKQFDATFGTPSGDQYQGMFGQPTQTVNSPNALSQAQTNTVNYNWTNTATYDLTVRKNVFTFLLGTEIIKNDVQTSGASTEGFVNQSPPFQYLSNGTTSYDLNSGGETHLAYSSVFGRVNYQYDNKYLASVNYRWDASSALDPDAQSQSFYSGSLGWRVDQEDFMKNVKSISTFKLRASYGQAGNAQGIGNYPYASLLSGNSYYPFGGTSNQGYTVSTIGNPNIRWETNTQADGGVDLGFMNNALMLTVDYYVKNTSNVLLPEPLPPSAGNASAPEVNAGKVRDEGLEVELVYRHTINNDWNYSLRGNFATLNDDVVSLGGVPPIAGGLVGSNYITLTQVGHPIGSFYLLQDEGIFQNQQQILTHAYQGQGIRPGDVMYKDIIGNGVIGPGDRAFSGSPIPKFTYGATANVSYKNFDLSLFFQGVYGNKIYNQVATDIDGFYRPFNITETTATKSWTGPGSTNTYPLLSWNDAPNNTQFSTRFLESGSYLKLKNAQLGYKLSSNLLKSLGISSARLYVSATNLLTFTKYTGLDPEMYLNNNDASEGPRGAGIDWGTYPSARTITLGINANF